MWASSNGHTDVVHALVSGGAQADLQDKVSTVYLCAIIQRPNPSSGGSRNLEKGVHLRVHEAHLKILGCHAHFRTSKHVRVIIVATDR